jgi:ankyrin repeat protein/Flp pilus assembly protein TadD
MIPLLRKLYSGSLALVSCSLASADDLCMVLDLDAQIENRDHQLVLAPSPVPLQMSVIRSLEGQVFDSGYVEVEFEITPIGTVRNPVVVGSVPPGLWDEAVIESLLKYRYKPRIVDREAVAVKGEKTVFAFGETTDDALEEDPRSVPSIRARVYERLLPAMEAIERKEFAEALTTLDEMLTDRRLNAYERAQVHNMRAFAYFELDDRPRAIEAYEQVIADPGGIPEQTESQAVDNLARLSYALDRYVDARRYADRRYTLAESPEPELLFFMARVRSQLGEFHTAIALAERALSLIEREGRQVPQDWPQWLAVAYLQADRAERALAIFEDLRARSVSESILHGLATAYFRIADYERALNVWGELLAAWPTSEYVTPIQLAAANGDIERIRQLLRDQSVDGRNRDGETALHWAAMFGQIDSARVLIEAGADVGLKRNSGSTPLQAAVQNGHVAVVELLIDEGADFEVLQNDGTSLLYSAAGQGHLLALDALIDAGLDVDMHSENGTTALHVAAREGHTSIVERLIVAGVDLDPKTERGWTPLSYAAGNGHADVAEQLIAAGADVAGVELAAERGFGDAQFLLGTLYADGRGVSQDDSLAYEWYVAALRRFSADAAYALGEMYTGGRGVEADPTTAAQSYDLAASLGHRDAQVKLGELYRTGVGVAQDSAEASMWSCLAEN